MDKAGFTVPWCSGDAMSTPYMNEGTIPGVRDWETDTWEINTNTYAVPFTNMYKPWLAKTFTSLMLIRPCYGGTCQLGSEWTVCSQWPFPGKRKNGQVRQVAINAACAEVLVKYDIANVLMSEIFKFKAKEEPWLYKLLVFSFLFLLFSRCRLCSHAAQ